MCSGPSAWKRLGSTDVHGSPEADKAQGEVERLRGELASLQTRIRRLVTNLEAQEPGSEMAADIRARMDELARLRSKKQAQLEVAEKEATLFPDPDPDPDPEPAEALAGALLLLDVDWELLRSRVPRFADGAELRGEL